MKIKYFFIPLFSSAILFSACSSIQSDLRNLIKETTGKDFDVSKLIKTSEGRKNLINSLKKSYESKPDEPASLLLIAWKQSAEMGEIGFDDIKEGGIYTRDNDPFKLEQKVEYFNMEYKILVMF